MKTKNVLAVSGNIYFRTGLSGLLACDIRFILPADVNSMKHVMKEEIIIIDLASLSCREMTDLLSCLSTDRGVKVYVTPPRGRDALYFQSLLNFYGWVSGRRCHFSQRLDLNRLKKSTIPQKTSGGVLQLTSREIAILNFLLKGYRAKDIASHLRLSIKTISYYKIHALKKLGVKNIHGLVYLTALQHH